jgi:hypothetical protein
MPTPFTTTTLYLLVELNSIGSLSAVDKKDLPAPFTNSMVLTLEQCNYIRGKMEHPEKTTCQRFDSPKYTSWAFAPPGAITPAQAAPIEPEIKADPTSAQPMREERAIEPKPKETAAPAPKKVAAVQRPRQEQQAMLDGPNPFSRLFNW